MTSPPRDVHKHRAVARARVVLQLVLCACCAIAGPCKHARAEDEGAEVTGYRAAITEALAEYEAQNYLEAMTLFARAHDLSPNARTLRGLGIASFELRRYSDSVSFLEQALASDEKPLTEEMRLNVEQLLTRARAFVSEITLVLHPPDALVTIYGVGRKVSTGRPLLLDVGKHEVRVEAPEYAPEQRTFWVEGGKAETWEITLRKAVDIGGPSRVDSASLAVWQKVVGITSLSLSVGSFVAAGILEAAHHRKAQVFRSSLPGTDGYADAYFAWKSGRSTPYVFAGAGSVLATLGALTMLLPAPVESFPWWASTLTGAAGIGLAAWGVSDIVRHEGCSGEEDLRTCSASQGERDRGSLVLIAAGPLLTLPIAQLIKKLASPSSRGDTAMAVYPQLSRHEITLATRWQWL